MSGPGARRGPSRTGWEPDPTGRFESRFRVGGRWTRRVRVAGTEATDPRDVRTDAPPTPGPWEAGAAAGAEWRADPTERFDERWWDGQGWTRHVRYRGSVATETTPQPLVARGRRGGRDAPGWRPDPDGTGQRYWNGYDWTAKTRPRPPARERRRRSSRGWWSRTALTALIVGVTLLVLVVTTVVALLT